MAGARLSVSLSGGASLGAYQAGCMAALLVAVERIRDEDPDAITLDAVGGASAGALVGLLTAVSHCCGLDPVAVMYGAWVQEVSLDVLLDQTGSAPLGADTLERTVERFLVEAEPVREPSAAEPVVLHVALSSLRGLTYHVDGLRGPGTVPASTYSDWWRSSLEPGLDRHELSTPPEASAIDVALASAANPGVFPPRLLDRSRDAAHYDDNGIEDLPDHGRMWFTDGGMMQTEPAGRVLEALRDLHDDHPDDRRLVLLVDPRSEGPSTGDHFGDPDDAPGWVEALSRSLSILPAQVLYDDLRRVARDNERLALADELAEALAPAMDQDTLADIRSFVDGHTGTVHGTRDTGGDDAAALLRAALQVVAGGAEKRPVDLDVLTPLLLVDSADRDGAGIESLLAGELLGDLGGFLDESLRHSDFVLGYATTLRWLEDGLPALGLDQDLVDAAVDAVRDAHEHDWQAANAGRLGLEDLPRRARLRLLELAGSAAFGMVAEAAGAVTAIDHASRLTSAVRDAMSRSPTDDD